MRAPFYTDGSQDDASDYQVVLRYTDLASSLGGGVEVAWHVSSRGSEHS